MSVSSFQELYPMSFKSIAALSLAFSLGFSAVAKADVVQTTVGIQQSDQYQHAEGAGAVQNAANLQQLGQYSTVRGVRRNENAQQTTAGIQTNSQTQESLGRHSRQNAVSVDDLLQNSSAAFRR
jgi:hypothetical protein